MKSTRIDSPAHSGAVTVTEWGELLLTPDTITAATCQVAGEVTPECQEPISPARVDRLEAEAFAWASARYVDGNRAHAAAEGYTAGARAALHQYHTIYGGVMGEVGRVETSYPPPLRQPVPPRPTPTPAATVPKGCIIDDKGQVRRVLGELVLTADGCVIGHGGTVFDASSRHQRSIETKVSPTAHWAWHSTKEAAQAAAAGKGGRDGR